MQFFQQNNVVNRRTTVHNWPAVSNAPFPLPRRRPIGSCFFKLLGAVVWLLIAIVVIGRCSAHAQPARPNESDLTIPFGWHLPDPARRQAPDTLRCNWIGREWVCRDRLQQTTCRMQGFEWVCDRSQR